MDRGGVIRVLGPIDLWTDAGVVPIGSRHLRALLAVLVVSAGHNVPVRQLEAAVWGPAPPPSAIDSLNTYISRLRGVLGHEVIECADHSYCLRVHRDQIDALRFEDLLARAMEQRSDSAACLALSREALGLWRGEPFGDLADEEALRLEAMRLDELRVVAMELALESELALGHSGIVVAELQNAVQEHPYRERLWYLLIRALHVEDRRIEAMRACQALRDQLAAVGLEAGDELILLEQDILHHDRAPG